MAVAAAAGGRFLQKFRLFETNSRYYLIGRNRSRTEWRVLKIDRLEPDKLCIEEDHTVYSDLEHQELLCRIHEGNRPTGGLRFVTKCYGIVGFVKFLGPYYMLLITERRKVGTICGHPIYTVAKSEIITIPSPRVTLPDAARFKDESRYRKLLCSVDLTKDFFFSYSYNIMRSLQKNITEVKTGQVLYETMFVWNEFLTRGIRHLLKNTTWTVALVHGFFKQEKLSVGEKDFWFTLVARRSRHFAGTRFLKRGVNEKGRVANDVETEQIVFEDTPEGIPPQIASVVQLRGSIPLFWFQETSRLNYRPDIILKKDEDYKATRLHVENLGIRYGHPIIILNLIKLQEKKPRESILLKEFTNAIYHINKGLPKEDRVMFLHFDMTKHFKRKGINVLASLDKVACYALARTDFLHCQLTSASATADVLSEEVTCDGSSGSSNCRDPNFWVTSVTPVLLQKGVLRTNCIDCLDRTNVAQFSYGLAALGRQLHALSLIDAPKVHLDSKLTDDVMDFYEKMGDTLAIQYGGSAAHNKIFCERRGQWKAATHSQEFIRTVIRFYSNAYMDGEKQDAINVFLGHFQPQADRPALWSLDSDQHHNIGRQGTLIEENTRSFIKRSVSDGSIVFQNITSTSTSNVGESSLARTEVLPGIPHEDMREPSDSAPDISIGECELTYPREFPTIAGGRHLFPDGRQSYLNGLGFEVFDSSNFLDLDWLSSSENTCDFVERCSNLNSPVDDISVDSATTISDQGPSDEVREETDLELSRESSQFSVLSRYSDRFAQWVASGCTLCY